MRIGLTDTQIANLKAKAKIENNREIYTIRFDGQEITINGDWTTQRNESPIDKNIVSAIEEYCTTKNINWEYEVEYRAWCD